MVTWVFSMQSQFVTLVTSLCTVLIGVTTTGACGGGVGANCTTHCLDNTQRSADPHSLAAMLDGVILWSVILVHSR